jgi:nucleoside-triphosphatase THEP1
MNLKLTQDEENLLLQRMRENPSLARRLFEMTDIIGEELGSIELADDAEDMVVENIRKTGKELLSTWAQKRADLATKDAKEKKGARIHEKKSSNGTRP